MLSKALSIKIKRLRHVETACESGEIIASTGSGYNSPYIFDVLEIEDIDESVASISAEKLKVPEISQKRKRQNRKSSGTIEPTDNVDLMQKTNDLPLITEEPEFKQMKIGKIEKKKKKTTLKQIMKYFSPRQKKSLHHRRRA